MLLAALLLCPNAHADVCFSDDVAGKIVVELERTENLRRQLAIQEQITAELKEQRDALAETVKLQKEQVEMGKKALEDQKNLMAAQEAACEKRVEAATPSFWHRLGTHTAAFGVGAIVAAVIVILL